MTNAHTDARTRFVDSRFNGRVLVLNNPPASLPQSWNISRTVDADFLQGWEGY